MAATPRGPLTPAERQALKQQIATAAKAKHDTHLAERAAKDKANVQAGLGKGAKIGARDPAAVRGGAKKDWRYRNKTGGAVMGDEKRRVGAPPKRVSVADATKAAADQRRAAAEKRAARRPSRAATPSKERPQLKATPPAKREKGPAHEKGESRLAERQRIYGKNPGEKTAPKPKATPKAPATGKAPTHYADALAAIRKEYADKAAAADKRKNPPAKENVQKVKSPAAPKNLAEAPGKKLNSGGGWQPEPSNRRGGNTAYDGTRAGARIANDRVQWLRDHPEAPPFERYGTKKPKGKLPATPKGGIKTNSQPGPGAPTGGTGRDADGGKGRTSFEDRRREGMAGQAKDRPPVYKPQDDGERGGYINRSSKGPVKKIPPYVRPSDKPTGKIPARGNTGTIRTDVRTIPAPAKKKLPPIGGSSVVKGLTPR